MPNLIALAMPGGQLFLDELRRAWNDGDAILPLDPRLPVAAKHQLLSSLGASALIDHHGKRHRLPGGRPVVDGDALVIATSGSTGEAKGVVHTHQSIAASAEITSRRLGVRADDHWLACLPLSHIGGMSVITRALHTDAKLTVLPQFDADQVLSAKANMISLVNTALKRIDVSSFRVVLLGGAAAPAQRPANTVVTYGSTETGSGVVYDGVALDGVELRIDDGQIYVKSPTLMRCYRDETSPIVDGWLPTGDAGSLDDGILTVFGRIDDVINTGGEKVWPVAVEQVLKTHPMINDAFVYGVQDAEWGQRVVVDVEVGGDVPSLEELRDHVKATMPAYCAPKEVRVVTSLPRTANGKLKRS